METVITTNLGLCNNNNSNKKKNNSKQNSKKQNFDKIIIKL